MSKTKVYRIIPNDQFLALINANNPSAANPFATIADVVAGSTYITVVANYSALPAPNTVVGQFYWVENSQGTAWLPGSLGGTYYPKGLYYSNGVSWIVTDAPYQASQAEVNAGVNTDKFVTPATLNASSQWLTKLDKSVFDLQNQTLKEPTGYPNRTDSTFSFNNLTREFTIQPVGASFDYWTQGEKFTINTPKTVTLPNVTDKYFIYFDDTATLGYTVTFDSSILNDKVLTATVYYNAITGKGEFVVDERHGLTMDWATHFHLHNAFGTRYYGGFGLSYTDGDGSLDTHAQIALGGGTIADEDIPTTIVDDPAPSAFFEQILSPIAQIPLVYKIGTDWQKDVANDYPLKDGGGFVYYNKDTAGVFSLEPVTNNSYVAVWIFATPEINTPIVSILGQREDGSLNDSKNNNTYDTIDWGDLPSQEYKILYRIIYEYKNTYTNAIKAKIVDVLDLRGSIDGTLASGNFNPVQDHGNLIGLNDDDHPQYHTDARGDARYSQLGHTHTASEITDFDTEVSNNPDVVANTAKLSSLKEKSGVVAAVSFAGNPKKATVTFGTAFADANYSVSILGVDSRAWSIENQLAGSFVINANANAALTGNVSWKAIKHGEN
jgi:hypothetical protein